MFYNWHRYYDPSSGRYLRSDPLGLFDGTNPFNYVHANPTAKVDPDGQLAFLAAPAAGSLGGFVGATANLAVAAGVIAMKADDDAKDESRECKEEPKCEKTYYHYTDEQGYLGIVASGYTIRANSRQKVYLTTYPMSSNEATNNIFAGGYGKYSQRGGYVIQFTMDCNVPVVPDATNMYELVHYGSLRFGKQINKVIYSGINKF